VPEVPFSHCLPSIAANAANGNIGRLAYRRFEVVTISVEGPFRIDSSGE
jgi:hypothetical protein